MGTKEMKAIPDFLLFFMKARLLQCMYTPVYTKLLGSWGGSEGRFLYLVGSSSVSGPAEGAALLVRVKQ